MNMIRSRLPQWILLGLPLLLGMTGLVLVSGEPFLQSLYGCVTMYLFDYGDVPTNILVEIARWTAPLATASGVMLAFATLRDSIRNFLRFRKGNSVAVYGPEGEKQDLLAQLGSNGIDSRERFVHAHRYILLHDEATNFELYHSLQAKYSESTVYLKCASLQSQSSGSAGLRLFCPEETAARLFWKEYCLYEQSLSQEHRLKLVFLGFGKLGQELLLSGLQNNIFSPRQTIEYHIFGDGDAFRHTHTQLHAVSDPVRFYDCPWYEELPLIESADMVVVLTQQGQCALLRDLLHATLLPRIHVFTAEPDVAPLLSGSERLELFDWKAKGLQAEHILSDTLYERAKRINLRYANLYMQVEQTEENKEAEWRSLDTFTRYSNISSADYHEVRLRMLAHMGVPARAEALNSEQMELLAELEHIRWCRYHYLNNWRYGIPANGKNKDKQKRIHKDLVDYAPLTDGEKEKDRENIRVLLSVE